MKRMNRRYIAVTLAASMWACDGSNRPSPTEPSAPPRPTYALSGVVSAVTTAGQAPVVKAVVEVSSPLLRAVTDASGAYRIDGVFAGPASVSVFTEDHETFTRNVTIVGDTRLDIQIDRRPFIVSGVVTEETPNGLTPVGGVGVTESYFHAEVVTDTKGFYKFEGPFAGISDSFIFTKEGYQTVTRDVTITGNTQLDVQLKRR